eukprot:TRINITY_DN1356_c0_g1_i1.p1 TRINITY_DN1356_c0_g1~~TRINITY_DN1356_c0_g1_i1.p1  ORF type:complete len:623 (-),score=150.68 TRINITY_DN1356_c0_g1_i1:53-1792(-)
MASTRKTCYYEVLGLTDRKCDAADIKTAYRKLALKMHPDKASMNGLTVEEATSRFQKIQEAYSILSDAQERAWYDSHREQILKGDDEPGGDPFKTRINLYKYFSTSCFEGFGDDARGFFAVYADLFTSIDTEEEEWEDADEDHVNMPPFGDSKTEWRDVSAFYRRWSDFCSRKAFGHADKWNPREAENRAVRRAMEQENKKERQAAKKEFNAEVRQLVKFVQKRDPRVAEHQKQQVKESVEKARREAEEKERKKAADLQQKNARKEAQRREEEERYKEFQAAKEARRAAGEHVSEDESSSSEEVVQFYCDACRKSFKSEKAFEQHEKSKKHIQAAAQLRRQMEEMARQQAVSESEDDEDSESESDDDSDAEVQQDSSTPAFAPPSRTAADESSDSDKDSSDEDAFVARFAAARGGRGAGGRGRGRGAGGASKSQDRETADQNEREDDPSRSSDGEEEDEAPQPASVIGGGKKADKRAKQQAILLEKSRQREQVQELVKDCKKAGKADASGEAPAAAASAGGQSGNGAGTEDTRCGVCKETFPSRSKLFQHIRDSGHAVLKEAPPADSAATKSGKRKGKR